MIKNKIKDLLSAEWYAFKLLFSVNVPLGILYIILYSLSHPVSLINTVLWKYVIDEFAIVYTLGSATVTLWVLLGIYLGIQFIVGCIKDYAYTVLQNDITTQAQNTLEVRVMRKVASLNSAFFDDPANRDMVDSAMQSKDRVSGALMFAVKSCLNMLTFAAGVILFVQINPLVSIVYLLTSIPAMLIYHHYDVQMNRNSIRAIPEVRKKNYYRSLLTGQYTAKDLRLYQLSGFFKEKYNTLWQKIRKEREQIFMRGTKYTYFSSILSVAGKAFLVFFSIKSILQGNMSLGTLSMFLTLSSQTSSMFVTLLLNIPHHFKINIPHIRNFREFMAYTDDDMTDSTTDELEPAKSPEIEFRDVCFRYPGKSEMVIDHLSLKIHAGKKIALIGVNGAGKSTFIKLLLRFYEPQSGQILINGRDIRRYSLDQLHRLFGVCFQNVPQYSLTVRENIALSHIDEQHNDRRLDSAAQASGIYSKYADFPHGIDSNLTRRFDDHGQELSGGEWQKIGIARAFFRDSPFVILDEPSSALDAQAEDELFSSFHALCKDKGGILVSHRLSAMMMVDEIVLLNSGRVMEQGTHEDLMQINGEYAKLYLMQAENYVQKEGI